jgi:tRNA pseudouridine32 synthase/23S rRNA pseudouridine746 synthase
MRMNGDRQIGQGDFSLLFENADVVAVSKPEGIATIPERGGGARSLLAALQTAREERLFVVHRLDKEASGVVLFAKNAAAHRWLNGQFQRREVTKKYAALVHGAVVDDEGTIDRPIRAFGSGRMGIGAAGGKPSTTVYRIVRRLRRYTLLDVAPESGRRHQIRVHLYSIGHPVVGDPRYGDKTIQSLFPRLMLHAREITVTLPSGEEKTVKGPIPETFARVLEAVLSEEAGRPPDGGAEDGGHR